MPLFNAVGIQKYVPATMT